MTAISATLAADTTAPGAAPRPSKAAIRAARITTGVSVAFLLFDATFKLFATPEAIEGTMELGYSPDVIVPLGLVQLGCLFLYLVPRTAILGALLWTGYLGGAIATHVRVGNPLFSHTLFPIYVAVLLWAGLWLRDMRVRALLPLRKM
jgi:hypothetical protein